MVFSPFFLIGDTLRTLVWVLPNKKNVDAIARGYNNGDCRNKEKGEKIKTEGRKGERERKEEKVGTCL